MSDKTEESADGIDWSVTSVPFHHEAWSKVADHLWIGGHRWINPRDEFLYTVPLARDFDFQVEATRCCWHAITPVAGRVPDGRIHRYDLPDGPLSPLQMASALEASKRVADAIAEGLDTLVRCHAGYNRSGLIAALALIEHGMTPAETLRAIRVGRGELALCQPVFVRYIMDGFTA